MFFWPVVLFRCQYKKNNSTTLKIPVTGLVACQWPPSFLQGCVNQTALRGCFLKWPCIIICSHWVIWSTSGMNHSSYYTWQECTPSNKRCFCYPSFISPSFTLMQTVAVVRMFLVLHSMLTCITLLIFGVFLRLTLGAEPSSFHWHWWQDNGNPTSNALTKAELKDCVGLFFFG